VTAPGTPPPWRALLPRDSGYPVLLGQISEPPPLLVRGPGLSGSAPAVALVGARRCTPYGEELAFRIAAGLAEAGVVVVSGLARGIDAAAHRGALAAGGRTVAVMGTGPDTIYPAAHRRLAEEIAAAGALVTQFPPGTPPLRANFPIRNVVISGLSLGVVVVEARSRSGAMITAGAAGDQGRVVMAVPGSLHSPASEGCHELIRDGAVLIRGPEDVLELIGSEPLAQLLPTAMLSAVNSGPQLPPRPPSSGEPQPAFRAWPQRSPGSAPPDPMLAFLETRPATLEELRAVLGMDAREAAVLVGRLRAEGRVGLSGGLYHALHPPPATAFSTLRRALPHSSSSSPPTPRTPPATTPPPPLGALRRGAVEFEEVGYSPRRA
jgi:DNA processing protein